MATRTCTKCGETKPLAAFPKRKKDTWCKACKSVYDKKYGRKHKERIQERKRKYRLANIDKERDRLYRRDFGFTLAQYDVLYEQQDGKCAICGKTQVENVIRLAVDHNHTTGAIRALLCSACNIGIGKLGDDIDRLKAAVAYLEAHDGNVDRDS